MYTKVRYKHIIKNSVHIDLPNRRANCVLSDAGGRTLFDIIHLYFSISSNESMAAIAVKYHMFIDRLWTASFPLVILALMFNK